jgi:para-nitrobenzyl esterase
MLANIFGAGDDPAGLSKMRRADPDALANFSAFVSDYAITPAFSLIPVFDGRALPEDPLRAMLSGDFAKVNILLGFNRDEGSLFVPENIDEGGYKSIVLRLFGGEEGAKVLGRFQESGRSAAYQRARRIFAYGAFSVGTKRFADIAAKAGANVYLYKFNYVSPANERNGLGAIHSGELPFVFGNLGSGYFSETGAAAQKLMAEMHTRWANFIKHGDPNIGDAPPTGVTWPKYDVGKANALSFNKKIAAGMIEDRENLDYIADLWFGALD